MQAATTWNRDLISDPIDKVTTFFTVYTDPPGHGDRSKARFPQGEKVVIAEEPAA